MALFVINNNDINDHWGGQWIRCRIPTGLAGELLATVTSGQVTNPHWLLTVCLGVDSLVAAVRYWIRYFLIRRKRGPLVIRRPLSAPSDWTAKPLPDLLKDIPATLTAHAACQHPDILTSPVAVLPRRHPRRGVPSRSALPPTFPEFNSFQGDLPSMCHPCVVPDTLPSGHSHMGDDGKILWHVERTAGEMVTVGHADFLAGQSVADLVCALRDIGDNLDTSIRNHKEPAVQALFGHDERLSHELYVLLRHRYVFRFIGLSIKLLHRMTSF